MFAVICKPEHIFVGMIMVYILNTVTVKNDSFSLKSRNFIGTETVLLCSQDLAHHCFPTGGT